MLDKNVKMRRILNETRMMMTNLARRRIRLGRWKENS
jgi:hypothetical protein